MSYFEDLSHYEYYQPSNMKAENAINVSWLDTKYHYNKGEVTKEFIDALIKYIIIQ